MHDHRRRFAWACAAAALALGWGCGDSGTPSPDADAGDGAVDDGVEEADDVEPDTDDDAGVPDTDADIGRDGFDDEGGADTDEAEDGTADDGGPTLLPVGSACTDGAECADGRIPGECMNSLGALPLPGGYCTAFGCFGDADCPGGAGEAQCLALGGGVSFCVDRCDPLAPDCRTGYSCVDVDGPGPYDAGCLPLCDGDEDCDAGETCDVGGDPPVCRSTSAVGNGEACETGAACLSGAYCQPEAEGFGAGWPGGICTQGCTDDSACTNGGVCVLRCEDDNDTPGDDCDDDGTVGLDPGAEGICLTACDPTDPSACPRSGYGCTAVGENLGGPVDVCTVDCSEPSACTHAGWECDPSAGLDQREYGIGRCQPPFDAGLLGGACTLTSGCSGGICLAEAFTGYPGGMCGEECTRGPGGDPCPGLAQCMADPGEPGLCIELCNPATPDCRPGWECTAVGGGVVWICQPACDSNDQCDYNCCRSDGSGVCDPSRTSCL